MSIITRIVRALLLVFLGACVVGFGVCGICGTLGGAIGLVFPSGGRKEYDGTMLWWGLIGLAVAFVCGKIIARMRRKSAASDR